MSTIKIETVFYCNSVRKEEYRDPKVGVENTNSFSFIDDKKKNKKEGDWTPCDNFYLNIANSKNIPKIEFGKKYKITIECLE